MDGRPWCNHQINQTNENNQMPLHWKPDKGETETYCSSNLTMWALIHVDALLVASSIRIEPVPKLPPLHLTCVMAQPEHWVYNRFTPNAKKQWA